MDRRAMLWCMGAGALALPARIVSAFAAAERENRVELLRGAPTIEREARQQELARAFSSSLGQRRIPGSAWGWSTACGVACDDPRTKEEEMMGATACGIPHADHRAKRFLFLYLPSTS